MEMSGGFSTILDSAHSKRNNPALSVVNVNFKVAEHAIREGEDRRQTKKREWKIYIKYFHMDQRSRDRGGTNSGENQLDPCRKDEKKKKKKKKKTEKKKKRKKKKKKTTEWFKTAPELCP